MSGKTPQAQYQCVSTTSRYRLFDSDHPGYHMNSNLFGIDLVGHSLNLCHSCSDCICHRHHGLDHHNHMSACRPRNDYWSLMQNPHLDRHNPPNPNARQYCRLWFPGPWSNSPDDNHTCTAPQHSFAPLPPSSSFQPPVAFSVRRIVEFAR